MHVKDQCPVWEKTVSKFQLSGCRLEVDPIVQVLWPAAFILFKNSVILKLEILYDVLLCQFSPLMDRCWRPTASFQRYGMLWNLMLPSSMLIFELFVGCSDFKAVNKNSKMPQEIFVWDFDSVSFSYMLLTCKSFRLVQSFLLLDEVLILNANHTLLVICADDGTRGGALQQWLT